MWGERVVKLRAENADRGQLLDEGNYAMFIHWGLYSQLANKVEGKTYYGIGEWIMHNRMAGIPVDKYKQLAGTFNPVKFDAKAIAKLAAERDVLPVTQFQEICTEGPQEADQITDEGEQRLLLNLLHDLGTIVAHGRDQDARAVRREITLLDPNWLTEAIYKILTSADCAEHQGRFNADHLDGWLDE